MSKPHRNEPRSYVVRVYRRTARWFAGCVEDVRSGRVKPFQTASQLWSAIGGPAKARTGRVPGKPKSKSTRKES